MSSENESPLGPDTLFDDADCGLLLAAASGRIERVNLTFCRWVGFSREELLGRTIQSLMTLESKTFHQAYWGPL
ncbi:PAS domain S-box protein [Pseudomonas sp. ZL2]